MGLRTSTVAVWNVSVSAWRTPPLGMHPMSSIVSLEPRLRFTIDCSACLADSSAGHVPDVKHCIAGASFAFYDRLFPHLGHVTDIRPHNPDLSKGRSVPDPV